MTDPLGNRLYICPLRFMIASPRVPIDLGCASVIRNSWRGDPESLRANRSAYYLQDQSLFVYYRLFYFNICFFFSGTERGRREKTKGRGRKKRTGEA